ncbi:hypothetical protein PPACK8108_LOCUS25387 [Phakopsora pachyrhizi]|uniref:Uncharacterized protein n=1 Tax=Phakopsora pachyrhizi TaxID=170000 RepID=A0AAV0BUK6_PHAPC|nr:hypothetical protein PPACK8108_LOCUS25387 [Phakopsora pachyrhizi]
MPLGCNNLVPGVNRVDLSRVEDLSIPTKTNIDYDRDGSAIDDEGSKEIIQEFDFESCEIPAAPAIDSAYPRWMEIILLQDKVKQKQLDFKNVGSGRRVMTLVYRMYSGSMGSGLSSSSLIKSSSVPSSGYLGVRVSEVRLLRNILVEDLSSQRLQLNGQNCFWRGDESQLKRRWPAGS